MKVHSGNGLRSGLKKDEQLNASKRLIEEQEDEIWVAMVEVILFQHLNVLNEVKYIPLVEHILILNLKK